MCKQSEWGRGELAQLGKKSEKIKKVSRGPKTFISGSGLKAAIDSRELERLRISPPRSDRTVFVKNIWIHICWRVSDTDINWKLIISPLARRSGEGECVLPKIGMNDFMKCNGQWDCVGDADGQWWWSAWRAKGNAGRAELQTAHTVGTRNRCRTDATTHTRLGTSRRRSWYRDTARRGRCRYLSIADFTQTRWGGRRCTYIADFRKNVTQISVPATKEQRIDVRIDGRVLNVREECFTLTYSKQTALDSAKVRTDEMWRSALMHSMRPGFDIAEIN